MGSSARKKKDKKKDFQKQKLKVGKTKPKAANFTDTSFKARSINISQQSLTTLRPNALSTFTHNLSLLSSHSSSQVSSCLAHLATHVSPTIPLPQPLALIHPHLLPLIYHPSLSVRTNLLTIFRRLPARDVAAHISIFILHVRLGLTRILQAIRTTALETLSWLLDIAGSEVVAAPGGWSKLLKCFMALFGWEQKGRNQNWTSEGLGVGLIRDKDDDGDRDVKSQLVVFGKFLRTGLGSDQDEGDEDYATKRDRDREHMLVDAGSHGLPEKSNPYGYLNLFGEVKEGDHGEEGRFEDREERRNWLGRNYEGLVRQSLENAKSHGGQAGRAAGVVLKVLASGFEGWKANDEENDGF